MIGRRAHRLDPGATSGTPRAGARSIPQVAFAAWRRSFWPVLLPLPLILLATWVIIDWRFNGLYGQDPFAYYDFSVGPLRHSLLDGAPLTAMFWPLGYPILVTLASLVLGPVPATGQVVNLAAGAAAVCLTYLVGRDLLADAGADPSFSRRAAALGALLLALTGRLVESSVLIMADTVALATALLSAWALIRWMTGADEGRPHFGWLVLAATALAWSVVTRWGQAVLVLAWLVALLPLARTYPSHVWRALPIATAAAFVVLGAQLWLIVTVRPDPTLGPLPFAGDLSLVNGTGSGWSLLHLVQHRFVTADGMLRYPWPNALFYATGPFLPQYLTPLFLPAAVLGFVTVGVRYHRALLLLLAWPSVLLLFDAGLAEQNPRFVLTALPPIALCAGVGLAAVWDRLPSIWRPVASLVLAAGLLIMAVTGMHELATVNRARQADLQVATWADARIPARATTLSFGLTLTLQHATRLRVLDLSELSQHDLRRLVARRRPLYLLIQVAAMDGQFAARPPGVNYRFLRHTPGLVQRGVLHGYMLAQVHSP